MLRVSCKRGPITEFSYIWDYLMIQPHPFKDLTQNKNYWTGIFYNRDVFAIYLTAPDRTMSVCEMKNMEQGFQSDLI